MWYGNQIYYLSDQDVNRRANIWVLDTGTRQTRQVTHFTDYDIDFPALGADAIAFQQGGKLFRLDLPSEHLEEVPVLIPDDGLRTRARVADVKGEIRATDPAQQVDYALAPNGKRTLFSARGDIFSVPTENGATRNLTSTPGVDEDHPAWSPDGRTIAYTTDAGGKQEIAIRSAEGGPEESSPRSPRDTSTRRSSRPMGRRWLSRMGPTGSGSWAPRADHRNKLLRINWQKSTIRRFRRTGAGSH